MTKIGSSKPTKMITKLHFLFKKYEENTRLTDRAAVSKTITTQLSELNPFNLHIH